jgi:uncharacterized membrane protein YsdA (DUF1294 family)
MTMPLGVVLGVFMLLNLVAFAAQGLDKRKAGKGSRRTPESTLLLLGLPLASPGMLLGMKVFRHKTSKRSFQAKAAVVVFANLLMAAGLGWMAMQRLIVLELALY